MTKPMTKSVTWPMTDHHKVLGHALKTETKMTLWDIKTLSQFLSIKPSTLYAWVAQGKIPHLKIQRLIRFRPEEIDDWLESFRTAKIKVPSPRFMENSQEDISALIDRVKRNVYNTQRETRPRQGQKGD